MLTLVLAVAAIGFFAGIVGLIVRLSGRAYPGEVTTSLGNEVDYENPFPGWARGCSG